MVAGVEFAVVQSRQRFRVVGQRGPGFAAQTLPLLCGTKTMEGR